MKPFENIKVLDLTHVIAGPFCTFQLAMLGAEVIKVEPPGKPDMMRQSGPDFDWAAQNMGMNFVSQNAGKKAITLDIKHPRGRAIFEQLLADADVLVENFRGSVLSDMGLDYTELKRINPQLIYCSMSGFGHTGPKKNHPAYDNVIQAFSGLMMSTGEQQAGAFKVGPPVLDYGTGAQAALAISAALYQRHQTGKGQLIDVAMLDAALMLMASSVTDTLATGQAPGLPGNSSAYNAGYGVYNANDGQVMIGAFTPAQQSTLWLALGQQNHADEVAAMSYRELAENLQSHRQTLSAIFAQESAQHWESVLIDAGVPASRVRTLDEALASEQVQSRAIIQEVEHPLNKGESLKVPVAAFSFETDGPTATSAPPGYSADTARVLQSIGLDDSEISALREQGVI